MSATTITGGAIWRTLTRKPFITSMHQK